MAIIELIKYGADIHKQDNKGNTPLLTYCLTSSIAEDLITLIEYGANVNKANNNGETLLMAACKRWEEKLVKILIEYGVDINKQDNKGNTPLHIACKYHIPGVTIDKYLIKKGANINYVDINCWWL